MVTCHDVVSEDPPETDSSESSDSDDSDSDTSWRSMSPISSDEEYFSDDSDDDDDDGDTSSHETVATADSSSSTSINLLQSSSHASAVILTLYKLYGDNTDKIVHQRYMRSDIHGTISLHYFHSYAIADRIDFFGLFEESMHSQSLNLALAFMLLPSLEDEEALRKNFKILIARCLYDNVPFFKPHLMVL